MPDRDRHDLASDEQFMRLALEEAKRAFAKGEIPVGAVAVYRNQVVGKGHNTKETEHDPTAHAEIGALRDAARTVGGWRLIGVTLYSTLEPCSMCAGALIQARVSRLVYAADDRKTGAVGSTIDLLGLPHLNHRIDVRRGVLEKESSVLLSEFFAGLRDGTIPRRSATCRKRQLAEKGNSG